MNKENAHLYLPLVQALADGKTIEILANRKGCEDWEEVVDFTCYCPPRTYRIKPESATVPLGPDDVPPGSAIRSADGYWSIVTRLDVWGLDIGSRKMIPWGELLLYWQIKRPGEDWKPCHKPA